MKYINTSIYKCLGCSLPVLIVLVAGCTNVGPNFTKPDVTIADNWQVADDAHINTQAVEDKDWWKVFNDPALDRLIETAYQQNLSLQMAGVRIFEARAQLGIASGLQYPQSQSVGAGVTRSKSSLNAPPFSNFPSSVVDGVDSRSTFFNTSFDAAWEVDIWGQVRRGIEAADANYMAKLLNYDSVLVTLTGDVAAIYISIRTIEERLAHAQFNIKLQREALNIARTRFKLGATSELDVDQSLALLKNTEAMIPSLNLALGQYKNALSLLLSVPGGTLDELIESDGKIPKAPTIAAVGIPADLIRRRPDVRAAEMAAATQSASVGMSEANLYPHFVLAGSIGVAADTFSNQFKSDSKTGYFTPFVRWDILNYGRIKNDVRVQDARLEQLLISYQNVVLKAAREVEDGLLEFLYTQERVGYLSSAVKASQRASQLALIQYRQGAVDYTRVLNTQGALLQQQDALTTEQGKVVSGLVSVYKSLGGGWQIREGQGYIQQKIKTKMEKRTDWGEYLHTPESQPMQNLPVATE